MAWYSYFKVEKVPLSQDFAQSGNLALKFGITQKNKKIPEEESNPPTSGKSELHGSALNHSANLLSYYIVPE